MGISSSIFHVANDRDRQTLHRRVTPTADQFEDQQERWNALTDHLRSSLTEKSGYAMRTWLQGSYKFGTQVRPPRLGEEFDIDLGVYFEWAGDPEDGDYEPDELKSIVQRSLQDYSSDDVIEVIAPPKPRCSRIRFEGDFHIDVPTYHLDSQRDKRMLATAEYGWEDSDPKALYLWFKQRFDDVTRTKARRQIRYMKCWAGLKFHDEGGRPSSTLLTVLVAEAFDGMPNNTLESDDDLLFAVIRTIIDRLERNPLVGNPVNTTEILTDRLNEGEFEAFLNKLREFRDIAGASLASEDVFVAADNWSAAFEHFFPMPDESELLKAAVVGRGLPAKVVVPEVQVRAVATNNPNARWEDTNKIGLIPKDCEIEFTITNADGIPNNAVIEWMVRNEGDEAENTNDLGHRAGSGFSAREHSAYRGTHYMDCVVRQYGSVIGMRRIPVTIGGIFTPRRNPLKRPVYVRLRGRR